MTYRDLSTSVLRGMLAALTALDALPGQRGAIQHELCVRAMVEAFERTIGDRVCVWTQRGGRS